MNIPSNLENFCKSLGQLISDLHACVRGYYRCTHKKTYNCPAKRTVQRLDADPSTFEVTYIHQHTCHLSSTAPSSVPLPPLPGRTAAQPMAVVAANPGNGWPPLPLSLGFRAQGGAGDGGEGVQQIGMAHGDAREAEYAVAHMADEMFNNRGATSSNSIMDLIFTGDAEDDKRECSVSKRRSLWSLEECWENCVSMDLLEITLVMIYQTRAAT